MTMIKISKDTLSVSVLALIVSSCSSTPASLTSYDPANSNASEVDLSMVHIISLADKREKDAVLTDLNNRPMGGADIMDWLSSSLERHGAYVQPTASIPDRDDMCDVRLELRRAHIASPRGNFYSSSPGAVLVGSSKASTIVLSVNGMNDSAPPTILRGRSASSNWTRTSEETNSSLSRALNDALAGLNEFCSPEENTASEP